MIICNYLSKYNHLDYVIQFRFKFRCSYIYNKV